MSINPLLVRFVKRPCDVDPHVEEYWYGTSIGIEVLATCDVTGVVIEFNGFNSRDGNFEYEPIVRRFGYMKAGESVIFLGPTRYRVDSEEAAIVGRVSVEEDIVVWEHTDPVLLSDCWLLDRDDKITATLHHKAPVLDEC